MFGRPVTTEVLSSLYSTERGFLRVYERSPVEDHLRAGVVSAAFVRIQHPRLFSGQSLHLTRDGHLALLMNHGTTMSPGWKQPPDVAAHSIAQIADALTALHRERILHLDIHVSKIVTMTIVVGVSTSVSLLDSELARHLDLAPPPGDFSSPLRAPELAAGKADVRSDVYGLGVLFHQFLRGDRAIAPPMGPGPLERLLARMLASDPDQRPSTPEDVRGELAQLGYRVDPIEPTTRAADSDTRIVVLSPELEEIARPFVRDAMTASHWIADTCELGLRSGNVYVTERPMRTSETAGSTDDPSAPLSVGDVVRIDDLAFVITTGDANQLHTGARIASITQRWCPSCYQVVQAIDVFCPHCGFRMDPQPAAPVAAPPLPPPPPPITFDDQNLRLLQPARGRIEPGAVVGNWQVGHLIAQGSFSTIYLAEHVVTGSRVALKSLVAWVHGEAVQWFTAEARLLSRLQHPNIVRVLDFGCDESGHAFMLLELLDGMTCQAMRERGDTFQYRTLLALARQMASALGVLHALEAVHRDVSPANIFCVSVDPPAFTLIDFELAVRSLESDPDPDPEREPMIHGTPPYMAPEHINDARHVDGRADLYSLGVVLYELATGSHPCTDQTELVRILYATLTVEPRPLLRPDLPDAFRALIMRLLSKDRADRPASATELLGLLARLPEG